MFSKITSFISASLRSLITPRRELAEGKAHAAVPSKRSREARGAHPPVKKRRRQSQVRFSTSRKNEVVHYSPSPVPSEIPLSPPLQHMSAEQRRAYAAGEVVVKEEPEDDVKASPPRPRRRQSSPTPAKVESYEESSEGASSCPRRRPYKEWTESQPAQVLLPRWGNGPKRHEQICCSSFRLGK
ncbi:hypothetical protein FOZ60_015361 [Perkinsus olseni]|uniref:Uncharacterized protein n=1 Tax=Perkinsus olseni TaxID=32597 RepID=A0A7J6P5X1_PEROL|nr:hypothetical protein FOZ60_015361 [Perkinsus olseni]